MQRKPQKREADRAARKANPEKFRARDRAKRRRHPEGPIMRSIVFRMLAGQKKRQRSSFYVGCTAAFLRNHIEAQFKPGMTWENYGKAWHIDHTVPLSWWDVENHPEHLQCASHYSNLQPLWKEENMRKGARWCA
jgi:hypothetical protein